METVKQRYPLVSGEEYPREVFPHVWEEAHLVFMDEKGKIRAGCFFGDNRHNVFDLGLVPDDIADQGSDAVRSYGEKKMNALIRKEKKRRRERDERILHLRREFEVRDGDVRIRGVVTKGRDNGPRDNHLNLTMIEPFQLEEEIFVHPQCWASSMAGARTFDVDGNFLEQEIARQNIGLLEMYRREVRRRNKPPSHPALAGLPRARRHSVEDEDD